MGNSELLKLLVDWIQNNTRDTESFERFCVYCDIDFKKAMEAVMDVYNNGVERIQNDQM